MLNKLIRFFLENRLVAWLLIIFFVGWGISVASRILEKLNSLPPGLLPGGVNPQPGS